MNERISFDINNTTLNHRQLEEISLFYSIFGDRCSLPSVHELEHVPKVLL